MKKNKKTSSLLKLSILTPLAMLLSSSVGFAEEPAGATPSPTTAATTYLNGTTLEKNADGATWTNSSDETGTFTSGYPTTIYGASNGAELTGNTSITISGTTNTIAAGGGYAKTSTTLTDVNADLTGSTFITINGSDASGSTSGAIYGGGYSIAQSGGTYSEISANVSGSTNLTVASGALTYIYGGGYTKVIGGYSSATSNVGTDVSIIIKESSTISNIIYSAGYAEATVVGSESTANVSGNIDVDVDSSTISSIIGGGYSVSSYNASTTGEDTSSESTANVGGIIDINISGAEITSTGAVSNSSRGSILAGGVAIASNTYATSTANVLNGDTEQTAINLVIEDSSVGGSVVLGSYALGSGANSEATADVYGNVNLDIIGEKTEIDGSDVYSTNIGKTVYGGSFVYASGENTSATANIYGDIDIDIEGSYVNTIYGGSAVSVTAASTDSETSATVGDIDIYLKDSSVGTIYGSAYISAQGEGSSIVATAGDVVITLENSSATAIYGATNVAKSTYIEEEDTNISVKSTEINLRNNSIVETIYAAGNTYSNVIGDAVVNLDNSSVTSNLYLGGQGYSVIGGNVILNAYNSTVGNLYLGASASTGTVEGNATATLTGNTNITGSITSQYVEGTTTVNFGTVDDAFTGSVSGIIKNVDTVNVAKDSTLNWNTTLTSNNNTSTVDVINLTGDLSFNAGEDTTKSHIITAIDGDSVELNGSGDITMTAELSTYNVMLYADTTDYTGNIYVNSGTLYLSGAFNDSTVNIASDATFGVLNTAGTSSDYNSLTFGADITGSGTLGHSGTFNYYHFTGDLSNFTGTMIASNSAWFYLDGSFADTLNLGVGTYYLTGEMISDDSILSVNYYGVSNVYLQANDGIGTIFAAAGEDYTGSVGRIYYSKEQELYGDKSISVAGETNFTGLSYSDLYGNFYCSATGELGFTGVSNSNLYGNLYVFAEDVTNSTIYAVAYNSYVEGDVNVSIIDSYIKNSNIIYGYNIEIDSDVNIYIENTDYSGNLIPISNDYRDYDIVIAGDLNLVFNGGSVAASIRLGPNYSGTASSLESWGSRIEGDINAILGGYYDTTLMKYVASESFEVGTNYIDNIVTSSYVEESSVYNEETQSYETTYSVVGISEAVLANGNKYGSADGDINLTLVSGNYYGAVIMGPNSATLGTYNEDGSTSGGNITLNILDGTYYGAIYAGSYWSNPTEGNNAGVVLGDVTLNISGGTFYENIYVGAYSDDVCVDENGELFSYSVNTLLGSATCNITGAITFGEGVTIVGGQADGGTTLNILSGFVNADAETEEDMYLFDANIEGFDTVNIYGAITVYDFIIDQNGSINYEETKSTDIEADVTGNITVMGSDVVSVGAYDDMILDGTITAEGVGTIYVGEGLTVVSDTAFVISNESTGTTNNVTDLSGTVSFIDDGTVEEKTAYSVDSNTVVSGEASTTYTTDTVLDADTAADFLKAIETTDGSIVLADDASVSASITDGNGDTYYGTALTNLHIDDSGLTLNLEGNATVSGNVTANSPLTISYTGASDDSLISGELESQANGVLLVVGGVVSTGYTADTTDSDIAINKGATLALTTDSSGTMASITDSGVISGEGTVAVAGSASMLVGSEFDILDTDTAGRNSTLTITGLDGSFNYNSATGTVVVDALTYFQTQADTANETALAIALDNINADGEFVGNDTYDAKVDFKVEAEANGLDYYVMSANSYIAEVNTMLLSNQNFANVNRARAILAKSANVVFVAETTEVDVVEEATGVAVVKSEEIEAIKYSNVAQLQVISLMGNKNSSNGVAGYDYYSVGSTANFDSILSDNALVGVSIGGTYNKVEGDAGDNANSTTFLLNAYATYAYEGFEFFGNIGYAHFWNEGSKAGSGSADWDSDAFNFLVGASYKLETTVEGLSISPVAMLNLVCLDADSATYSNGVTVDDQSYFSAKLMFGFEVEYAVNAQLNVLARAMYSHEMGDTSYDNTYSLGFVNDLQYIGSEAGADSAVMGLGLSYDFSESCTAYFDYNAYAYSNLITHSLNLSVALKF